MMYMDYINKFSLPNRNLGLYVVDSFVFDLQKIEQAPRRSASTRITHNPQPWYYGDDPILEGPAFTGYIGFDQAEPSLVHHPMHASWDQPGSSHMHQPEHAGWEQPSSHHSESSWQQGPSGHW